MRINKIFSRLLLKEANKIPFFIWEFVCLFVLGLGGGGGGCSCARIENSEVLKGV